MQKNGFPINKSDRVALFTLRCNIRPDEKMRKLKNIPTV